MARKVWAVYRGIGGRYRAREYNENEKGSLYAIAGKGKGHAKSIAAMLNEDVEEAARVRRAARQLAKDERRGISGSTGDGGEVAGGTHGSML